ncbi:MAG: M48 family metallopeptidase [Steroidobacteraceae bacterium]
MPTLTILFLLAVLASTAMRLWLAQRQMRSVRQHRAAVPEPFVNSIELADHQKAADYTLARARLGQIDTLLGAIVLLLATLGGGIDLLESWWQSAALPAPWHGVAVIASLMLLMTLIDLPLSWLRTFRIEARFGFNRTTQGRFLFDLLKGLLLGAVLGLPLLWVVLRLMASAGSAWWLYAWAVWLAFSLLISWAWPIFIAPLFNKFTPLKDEALAERISQLLSRCHFSSAGVFVMDGSARSTHGNAYFTGLGRHKRIVFFDTLMERLSPTEIEAVLAHELGHYSLHHIRKGLILSSVLSLAAFALLGYLATWPGFYTALGVQQPSMHAALLLFMLASGPFLFFLTPLGAAWSRKHEFEADTFASQHANARELITALVKLYRDNASTLTPDVVHSHFYDSHPPALERIAFLEGLLAAQAARTA